MIRWPFRKKWETLGCALSSAEAASRIIDSAGEKFPLELKDARYRAIPWDHFYDLMVRGLQPILPYEAQIFDCDDMALCWEADIRRYWAARAKCNEALLCGQALLTMKSKTRHVMGWHLGDDGVFRLVECFKMLGFAFPFTNVQRIEQARG